MSEEEIPLSQQDQLALASSVSPLRRKMQEPTRTLDRRVRELIPAILCSTRGLMIEERPLGPMGPFELSRFSAGRFALTGLEQGAILRRPGCPCLRRNLRIGSHPHESRKTRHTVVCHIAFVIARFRKPLLAPAGRPMTVSGKQPAARGPRLGGEQKLASRQWGSHPRGISLSLVPGERRAVLCPRL